MNLLRYAYDIIAFRASVMNDDGAMLGQCLVRRIEQFWHDVIHTEPFQHVVGIFVSLSATLWWWHAGRLLSHFSTLLN